ncbi:hypothetical protein Y032_0055g2614 [Ancylostoma ceylanicum]|nr:hypothetical protein Y032_0055g2614 [Ancylostoma ceylanicum]
MLSSSQVKTGDLGTGLSDSDIDALSNAEIINVILERNTDPVIEKLAQTLRTRISREILDAVEEEKRGRSLVISGLPECDLGKPLLERQKDLEIQVANILDILEVDCLPETTYRMGVLVSFTITVRGALSSFMLVVDVNSTPLYSGRYPYHHIAVSSSLRVDPVWLSSCLFG